MYTLSLKNFIQTALLLVTCLVHSTPYAAQAEAPVNAKVKESMKVMKGWAKILGEAKLDGENLYFGKTHLNADFFIVDGLKSKFGGTATFFAKKGDGFIRVSTNVMKDGKRAVGTMLDPNGPVIVAIKQGKGFYGTVDILGKMYDTGYEPIFTSKGEIVGIFYVGYAVQ
jgi:hypothetical protein